ncbi:MAG TPA: hypothetical protein VD862_03835 [Candidatus Paceibacterota bacterium]|nr:hypothetical protein [Candidatus Paceibacterota bacterium]
MFGTVLLAVLVAAQAPVQPPPDAADESLAALMRFGREVEEAARTLNAPGRIVLARTNADLKGDPEMPAAIAKIPDGDPLRERGMFIIYVKIAYLNDHPEGAFRHDAAHEVCHAVLGHLDDPESGDEDRDEWEAEHCAYAYMGEDAFIAFMREEAKRKEEYRLFADMDERTFRNLIRTWLGYEPLPEE